MYIYDDDDSDIIRAWTFSIIGKIFLEFVIPFIVCRAEIEIN